MTNSDSENRTLVALLIVLFFTNSGSENPTLVALLAGHSASASCGPVPPPARWHPPNYPESTFLPLVVVTKQPPVQSTAVYPPAFPHPPSLPGTCFADPGYTVQGVQEARFLKKTP